MSRGREKQICSSVSDGITASVFRVAHSMYVADPPLVSFEGNLKENSLKFCGF